MSIYIGAENIITPLGKTAADNFESLKNNQNGGKKIKEIGFKNEDAFLIKFDKNKTTDFIQLVEECLKGVLEKLPKNILTSDKTLLILSTTKGNIVTNQDNGIASICKELKSKYALKNDPLAISNACISGVLAINAAADYLNANLYENVIVIGCDVISDFVLFGFQSLFALSDEACLPFNENRKGINLGEGCAAVVLSKNAAIFQEKPLIYVSGSSSNDANHISGPSRTGEGLYRSVLKTLKLAGLSTKDIDYISGHGTATVFNDEMESIAFERLQMNHIPINSLKGYFGHTLGAAGLIETVISMQSIRNDLLIKSLGFKKQGTSKKLNIIEENRENEINTILKTASGFGGCNASLIIKRA
jgi:3-oxoacyl-[acyl-carrier-protein] synthase-1